MTFTSLAFFAFYSCVFLLYLIISPRLRWLLLLISSYVFYASWRPEFIFLLLFITGVTYLSALQMEKIAPKRGRLLLLTINLIIVLGALFLFKYFNFFFAYLAEVFLIAGIRIERPVINLLAPIGISFYSLQIIGYSLDVYRGTQKPEKHFGKYALFISFFPQMISGPIARAKLLIPQFNQSIRFDRERFRVGIHKVMWGLFLKTVIADRLAPFVDQVYGAPSEFQGGTLILATYCFSFQIYCDFAGYSNIAIGLARMIGIDLVENFNFPYISKDIAEFWNRWHISLSTWLRDYIFYPASRTMRKYWTKSRVFARMLMPAMITMLVSGIWHGEKINFLIWGMIHGVFLFLSVWTEELRARLLSQGILRRAGFFVNWVQIFITFNIVSFSWIFFRATNRPTALLIIKKMFLFDDFRIDLRTDQLVVLTILILILWIVSLLQRRGYDAQWLAKKSLFLRVSVYYTAIFVYLYLGNFESVQDFIYTRF